MTPRENILSCLRRRGYDHIPLDINLCASQIDAFERRFGHRDYRSWFGVDHQELFISPVKTWEDVKTLYPRETLPEDTEIDEYGVGHSKGSEAAFHMTRMHHPLRGDIEAGEIEGYPLPKIDAAWENGVGELVRSCHGKNLAAVAGWQCTIWERAWYLRGMEDLMVDMATEDEKATLLLDRITALSTSVVETWVKAGADIVMLGDDIGTQRGPLMSVELWERWLKPRLSWVIGAAKKLNPELLVFYHSCGNCRDFVPGLIEAGVDVLNPLQPEAGMDYLDVHREWGQSLSFWGGLGTQQLLPWGTPEEVAATSRAYLAACGDRGGLVLGPTHLVEPEVPWENLLAFKEAAAKGA